MLGVSRKKTFNSFQLEPKIHIWWIVLWLHVPSMFNRDIGILMKSAKTDRRVEFCSGSRRAMAIDMRDQ
jgi:hypothetical protein